MITESKISSPTYKSNLMESTWLKSSIEELFIKLLSMISFLLMLRISHSLLKLREENKFGSSFYKNVGLNFINHMLQFRVDFLIKSFTLFLELQDCWTIFQTQNKNSINFLKSFIMHIKTVQFYVVEQNLIFQSKRKDL